MNQRIRRAIILAAGRGSRLQGAVGDVPKCLAPMGTSTLLERQIRSLRAAGIRDLLIVVGYGGELVRRTCAGVGRCLENRRYFETNSLYSLWLARRHLDGGCVIMNGDVLFHPQLLADLLAAPFSDALLLSERAGSKPLGDEEMKVILRDGCVDDISKQIDGRRANGENVGILKFSKLGARLLSRKLDALVAAGATRDWAPRAFREFARDRPLHSVPTHGLPWIEIDYPDDYYDAINRILPLIEAREAIEREADTQQRWSGENALVPVKAR